MFWFINLCISNVISANGFVIQDTFNVLLKDDADYKVDLIISADDYEMIDQNELKQFTIENDKEIFKKLNDMARSANSPVTWTTSAEYMNRPEKPPDSETAPMILVTSKSITMLAQHFQLVLSTIFNKRAITTENETKYDYDNLLNEYYDEANNESRSKNAYHISKSVIELPGSGAMHSLKDLLTLPCGAINCSEVDGIGLLALKCWLSDCYGQRESMRNMIARFWKIFQIWFLVYLAVAIPFWCTRGWCCCCLYCKFFKPQKTIEEAKRYLVAYPPGVFKSKNGNIRYTPSDREKECYQKFEHFIKTL